MGWGVRYKVHSWLGKKVESKEMSKKPFDNCDTKRKNLTSNAKKSVQDIFNISLPSAILPTSGEFLGIFWKRHAPGILLNI